MMRRLSLVKPGATGKKASRFHETARRLLSAENDLLNELWYYWLNSTIPPLVVLGLFLHRLTVRSYDLSTLALGAALVSFLLCARQRPRLRFLICVVLVAAAHDLLTGHLL
jgi:hypothetical protein